MEHRTHNTGIGDPDAENQRLRALLERAYRLAVGHSFDHDVFDSYEDALDAYETRRSDTQTFRDAVAATRQQIAERAEQIAARFEQRTAQPGGEHGRFTEQSLLNDVVDKWGGFGAHADLLRRLINTAEDHRNCAGGSDQPG